LAELIRYAEQTMSDSQHQFVSTDTDADEQYKARLDELHLPRSVANDLPCPGCGYNLRGLATDAQCPECGAQVWIALTEHALAVADPHWMSRVTNGIGCLTVAGVVLIAGLFLSWIVELLWSRPQVIGAVGMGLATALVFVGILLITTPDPADTQRVFGVSRSTRARVCAIASILGVFIAIMLARFGGIAHLPGGILVLASPIGISGWICLRDLTVLFELLARRVHDPFGAERVSVYRKWIDRCGVLLVLSLAAGALFSSFFWAITFFVGAAWLGYGILTLTLPCGSAYRLSEYARIARELRAQSPTDRGVSMMSKVFDEQKQPED